MLETRTCIAAHSCRARLRHQSHHQRSPFQVLSTPISTSGNSNILCVLDSIEIRYVFSNNSSVQTFFVTSTTSTAPSWMTDCENKNAVVLRGTEAPFLSSSHFTSDNCPEMKLDVSCNQTAFRFLDFDAQITTKGREPNRTEESKENINETYIQTK